MTLEEQLNQLYMQLTIAEFRKTNDVHLKQYGNISYISLIYLEIIEGTEKCTPSKLADLLGVTRPAVTAKVNELIRQGLVEKQTSQEDKRVVYLEVTERVNAWKEEYDSEFKQIIASIEQKFSQEERDCFTRILSYIAKSYEEYPGK